MPWVPVLRPVYQLSEKLEADCIVHRQSFSWSNGFDTLAATTSTSTLASQCAYACLQERLGVILEKEDEMDCLVAGCNFLFKAIYHEAFMYEHGKPSFVTGTGAS